MLRTAKILWRELKLVRECKPPLKGDGGCKANRKGDVSAERRADGLDTRAIERGRPSQVRIFGI